MEENVDNYSDVDWSDDAGSDEEGVNESAGHSETLQIDIGGSTSKAVDEKKRKREICTYNDEDRSTALERHQDDLRTSYYRAILLSKWCNDEVLAGMLVSLLPKVFLPLQSQKRNTNVEDVIAVANWFKKNFTKVKDTFLTADEGEHALDSTLDCSNLSRVCFETIKYYRLIQENLFCTGRDGSDATELVRNVIPNMAGSAHQLNQLLVSILRACGFEVLISKFLILHIHCL